MAIRYQPYQIPNLPDTEPSYTEPLKYRTSQIPNLSDTEPIRYRTNQILKLSFTKKVSPLLPGNPEMTTIHPLPLHTLWQN